MSTRLLMPKRWRIEPPRRPERRGRRACQPTVWHDAATPAGEAPRFRFLGGLWALRASAVSGVVGLAVGLLAVVVALPGCGYRTGELYRPGIRTVHVEMFASQEFRRDLEFKLTEAVAKRISLDTPFRLAPREKADTILMGEVLEQRQAAFATDYRSRLPREKQLTLAVRVQWKDLRSGRLLVDQPVELQAVDYLAATGETEAFAQERAIDRLAARIVAKMYNTW